MDDGAGDVSVRVALRRVVHSATARRLRHQAGRLLVPVRRVQLVAMYRRSFVEPLPDSRARVPITIAPADVDQIAAVADVDGHGAELEPVFRWRLDNGHHCLVAWFGDEIVGYNWMALGHTREADELLRMADDEAFFYDGYTAAEWRGNGIHPALHCWQIRYARDMGVRTGYSQAVITTRRTRRMIKRFGWSLAGWTLYLKGRDGHFSRSLRLWGSTYPTAGIIRPDAEGVTAAPDRLGGSQRGARRSG